MNKITYVTGIIFNKDVWNGHQHPTDFINVDIGDNYTCEEYKTISKFYKDLSFLPSIKLEEVDVKKDASYKKVNINIKY